MRDINLTADEKRAIKENVGSFRKYTQSAQFAHDREERIRRVAYFQRELPDKIAALSEADVEQLVSMLWASRMWGNKQYLVDKVIADNGIEKLRHELKLLLDTTCPVGTRYERFLKEVKQLGPASLTEILTYSDPKRCGIWNNKARQALKILGLANYVNPDRYRLSAVEYETFNAILRAVAGELRDAGLENLDLLFVDYFLYEVAESSSPEAEVTEQAQTFDHDEIRDLIASIGLMFGFETQTEFPVAHGAKSDVVWRVHIGNLGQVTYVFEVHKSGSIDSLLLNLQKAKSRRTVQKVIAVSDSEQLEKIKKEAEDLPEEFRRALALWQVSEVQKVNESLGCAVEIINRLGLVPGSL